MRQIKQVYGEVLSPKPRKPTVNCAGCINKSGRFCLAHSAYLQSNPNRPTDCILHRPIKVEGEPDVLQGDNSST